MKISPSETAREAFMGSPPMEFVARHSNLVLVRSKLACRWERSTI